jgi:hypothetical protein
MNGMMKGFYPSLNIPQDFWDIYESMQKNVVQMFTPWWESNMVTPWWTRNDIESFMNSPQDISYMAGIFKSEKSKNITTKKQDQRSSRTEKRKLRR